MAKKPKPNKTDAGKEAADTGPGKKNCEQEHNKPKLTIVQQVSHQKKKSVKFEKCSEEDAAYYLAESRDLFEASAYRKLFSKRQGGERDGQYVDLDFAQLVAFAELDEMLRETLLIMTRHIESRSKVILKRDIAELEGEDGYAIVSDYMNSLTPKSRGIREGELERNSRNKFTMAAYEKYKDDMPSWVFLELVPFGTLVDFTRFCGARWGNKGLEQSHYDLKKVKSVRNCAAHGSCIINLFAEGTNSERTTSRGTLEAVAKLGLSKPTRQKWLRNAATQEIAVTLVRYAQDVPEGPTRKRDEEKLKGFFDAVDAAGNLIPKQGPDAMAFAAISFIKSLTANLGLLH